VDVFEDFAPFDRMNWKCDPCCRQSISLSFFQAVTVSAIQQCRLSEETILAKLVCFCGTVCTAGYLLE